MIQNLHQMFCLLQKCKQKNCDIVKYPNLADIDAWLMWRFALNLGYGIVIYNVQFIEPGRIIIEL